MADGQATPGSCFGRPALDRRALVPALVAVGGFFGAAAREAVEQTLPTPAGSLPVATLAINCSGAYLLGLLLAVLLKGAQSPARRRLQMLVGTGFLGAFTTYSTFAVEADLLVRANRLGTAALYVAVTAVGGLIAALAGIASAALPARPRPVALPLDPDVDPVIAALASPEAASSGAADPGAADPGAERSKPEGAS